SSAGRGRPGTADADANANVAAARPKPTRASLCPPPTVWTTIAGLTPTRAATSGVSRGSRRRAAAAANQVAPATATPASTLKARIVAAGEARVSPAAAALRTVNAGPYTDRLRIQSPDTA